MAIPDYVRANFQTLLRAAEAGHLALLECTDAASGDLRYVLTATVWDGEAYVMTPFGHLCLENPFEVYRPTGTGPLSGDPARVA